MEKPTQYAIIGGLVGAVLVLLFNSYAVNNRNYQMMNMMGMGRGATHMMSSDEFAAECHMDPMHGDGYMSMDDMIRSLINLKDEEFDQAFLEIMIGHHQGAIDMAKLIDSRTERQELRDLGEEIISTQTKEIEMMNGWLVEWFVE